MVMSKLPRPEVRVQKSEWTFEEFFSRVGWQRVQSMKMHRAALVVLGLLLVDRAVETPNHTTNPVPIILIDDSLDKINDGILGALAPTILKLMGIEPPLAMTQESMV